MRAAFVFAYLMEIRGKPEERPLNTYITGLTFFSKIDWHLRFELNTFEEFFKAFRALLGVHGVQADGENVKASARRQFASILRTTDELEKHIDLGLQLEAVRGTSARHPEITLTEVVGMKLYCDLLITKIAQERLRQRDLEEADTRAMKQ